MKLKREDAFAQHLWEKIKKETNKTHLLYFFGLIDTEITSKNVS